MDNPISREQFLAALDTYPLHELYEDIDVLRLAAHDRNKAGAGELRLELMASLGCTNILVAMMLREVAHGLDAIRTRLPLESSTSTDWITPRDEARRNREARRTA